MRLVKSATLGLLLLIAMSWSASAATFSLSGDWSNTANPAGPWAYRQGSIDLPLVSDWTGSGSVFQACKQPAWAPSNISRNFLPALMKANSCTATALGTDPHNGHPNALPGDVVVHTVDGANGNPSKGVANVLFTLPAGDAGFYEIKGFIWDADLLFGTTRPQGWTLLVNGVQKAGGLLSGTVSRSQAQPFDFIIHLAAGDKVELDMVKESTFGFFVGVNMTIGPPSCIDADTLSYNATTGILTMNFTLGTAVPATWNGWISFENNFQPLWTQSLAITEPPISVAKTHSIGKSGRVGVLSTLTTPTGGIVCSSWQTINTGTP